MNQVLRPALALLIGSSAGAALSAIHASVPWLIGPLLAVALCNIAGAGLETPRWMRSMGQWLIGVALGLHFTPTMVVQIAAMVPYMVLAGFMAIAFGTVGGWAVSRFSKVDRATAHFATAMGGAPEMAVAAERTGANIDQVVTAHMLRVILTVVIVPAAVQYGARLTPHTQALGNNWLLSTDLVLIALVSLGCAAVAKLFNFPNSYALVPLFLTATVTACGVVDSGALPRWVSIGAQILVAVSLAVRFTPSSFGASRRLLGPVIVYSLSSIVFAAVFGFILAYTTGLALPAGVLSLAPGGMADMGVAAESLGLMVPVVTGFHVIRVALVVLLTLPLFKWVQARRPGSQDKP